MKTIQLTDNTFNKLMELSKKLNNQSHRGTAMPYFFQVIDNKRIYGIDSRFDYNGYVWVKDGDNETEPNREDMIEQLLNDGLVIPETITDDELYEFMEDVGYEKVYYRNQKVFSNAFFTEDACKDHIKGNMHHYEQPSGFLSYAFRNSELELVQQFLCELSGGKLHK